MSERHEGAKSPRKFYSCEEFWFLFYVQWKAIDVYEAVDWHNVNSAYKETLVCEVYLRSTFGIKIKKNG